MLLKAIGLVTVNDFRLLSSCACHASYGSRFDARGPSSSSLFLPFLSFFLYHRKASAPKTTIAAPQPMPTAVLFEPVEAEDEVSTGGADDMDSGHIVIPGVVAVAQRVHVLAPARAYVPAGHVKHCGSPGAADLPASHKVQRTCPAAEEDPPSQVWQLVTPEGIYVPAEHCEQALDPCSENVPGAQLTHLLRSDFEYVPAGHIVQEEAAFPLIVPSMQSRQGVAICAKENFPGVQAAQVVLAKSSRPKPEMHNNLVGLNVGLAVVGDMVGQRVGDAVVGAGEGAGVGETVMVGETVGIGVGLCVGE
jgi:hypothetical protein